MQGIQMWSHKLGGVCLGGGGVTLVMVTCCACTYRPLESGCVGGGGGVSAKPMSSNWLTQCTVHRSGTKRQTWRSTAATFYTRVHDDFCMHSIRKQTWCATLRSTCSACRTSSVWRIYPTNGVSLTSGVTTLPEHAKFRKLQFHRQIGGVSLQTTVMQVQNKKPSFQALHLQLAQPDRRQHIP